MNPFEMVVLIVAIVTVGGVLRARMGGGGGRKLEGWAERIRQEQGGEAEQLRGEVRQLKDRIAVLERIVTDGDSRRGLALEREIEALRESRQEAK